MLQPPAFGGKWTDEKLDRLRKYLPAYLRIFKSNPRARYFRTIYVDAFAGAGYRTDSQQEQQELGFPEFLEPDARAFRAGSARIALEIDPSFDNYVFVEQDAGSVAQLDALRDQFPEKAPSVEIHQGEANTFLRFWCGEVDWRRNRAVMFLDPYGMQVDWSTIEAIARTRAIDLWLLFPLGMGINRLLTRGGPPPVAWANALTRIFGTEAWRDAFYVPSPQMTMFDALGLDEKRADFDEISRFFVDRLKSVFAGVAENPLPLYNSRNIPLYLLCFAAGNERGAETAIRIASHILRS